MKHDLNLSKFTILVIAQKQPYSEEYSVLSKNKILSPTSSIISLNPIVEDELIRVGGRISKNQLTVSNLNQVIINKKHPLSKLMVSDHHRFNFYIGCEHTIAAIRKHYWIPSCRGLIRTVLNKCFQNPLMSDLPKERFSINEKPFSKTGIDYFGPIYVKTSKKTRSTQRNKKRYGVLFTCLTTRVIHL